MPPVEIDNPILNSPFSESTRHFRFDDDGIPEDLIDPPASIEDSGRFVETWVPRV